MRYIKLFLISVIVFSILLFCLSLLFPSTTYVSRATNVLGEKNQLAGQLSEMHQLAFQEKSNIAGSLPVSDTLLRTDETNSFLQKGVAVYTLHNDSTAIQVFYKIYVPWYKPWNKFGLMLNETKYGPVLDAAIIRLDKRF